MNIKRKRMTETASYGNDAQEKDEHQLVALAYLGHCK
jgi:hypothetical protein